MKTMRQPPKELSFFDHLDELRTRIIKSALVVFICACVFYFTIDKILVAIIKPVGKLIFTSPPEAFLARMTITLFGGFFAASPFILYQVWSFVSAGLTEREKQYVKLFGPFSFVCFVAGGLFAYFVMIPLAVKFLLSFSTELMLPMITVEKYITFVSVLTLAGGIVFELPLILMFLTKIGIVTPDLLREKRRHAIVGILFVSAVLTPPDVFTQMLLSVPLIILYEVSILVSGLTCRKQKTSEKVL